MLFWYFREGLLFLRVIFLYEFNFIIFELLLIFFLIDIVKYLC